MVRTMSELSYRGGCLCGAVRFEVSGPATFLCYCHCLSCRRASGAPLVAWGTFPSSTFVLTAGALTERASSAGIARGFCAACGTGLTYRRADWIGDEIDVTLASLESPELLAPTMHVWVAHKLPWMEIADGLPQYPHGLRDSAP
jgi:hypothetical protein